MDLAAIDPVVATVVSTEYIFQLGFMLVVPVLLVRVCHVAICIFCVFTSRPFVHRRSGPEKYSEISLLLCFTSLTLTDRQGGSILRTLHGLSTAVLVFFVFLVLSSAGCCVCVGGLTREIPPRPAALWLCSARFSKPGGIY